MVAMLLVIALAIATTNALRLGPSRLGNVVATSRAARRGGSVSVSSSGSGSVSCSVSSSRRPVGAVTRLHASTETADDGGFDAAAWLNINTRGGIIVWSGILTLVPIAVYQYFISQGYEDTTVGAYVGALFVLLSMVGWASTYLFRVATKDMTYAKQVRGQCVR